MTALIWIICIIVYFPLAILAARCIGPILARAREEQSAFRWGVDHDNYQK